VLARLNAHAGSLVGDTTRAGSVDGVVGVDVGFDGSAVRSLIG
jgi:hypothetical protein